VFCVKFIWLGGRGGRVINLPIGKKKKAISLRKKKKAISLRMGRTSLCRGQDTTKHVQTTQGEGQLQISRFAAPVLACPEGSRISTTESCIRGGPSSCTNCRFVRTLAAGKLVQHILLQSQCSFYTRLGAPGLYNRRFKQKYNRQAEG
jgi:hypothetical protein